MLQTKKYSKEQLLQELNGNDGDVASDELEEIVNMIYKLLMRRISSL